MEIKYQYVFVAAHSKHFWLDGENFIRQVLQYLLQ